MTPEEHAYVTSMEDRLREQIALLKSMLLDEKKRSAELFKELEYWKDTAIRFERRVFVLMDEIERLSKP